MRFAKLVFPFAVLGLLFAGCAQGFGPEEAAAFCDHEKLNNTNCFNTASYDACTACYEQCGDHCARMESCPVQFACPQ